MKDKWALVLGATSGTGLAIAKRLITEPGLNVIGVHRGHYPENGRKLEECARRAHRRCLLFEMDAGTEGAAQSGVSKILSAIGSEAISVSVHAISSATVGPLVKAQVDERHKKILKAYNIDKTFNAMAHSFVYWTRELFHRRALAPKARVVALLNYVVPFTLPGMGAIAASKAALEAYVRYLGRELGESGIVVFGIRFGATETPSLKYIFGEDWEGFHKRTRWLNNLKEHMLAEDVARILPLFLTDETRWITGSILPFDGAETAAALNFVAKPPKI